MAFIAPHHPRTTSQNLSVKKPVCLPLPMVNPSTLCSLRSFAANARSQFVLIRGIRVSLLFQVFSPFVFLRVSSVANPAHASFPPAPSNV